ncbi:MAG: hypothetical protein GKR87_14410 [Kiritimatiellae bacterium]|nr:hypothetical protein [Kiritimatiellia bacterium]
MSQGLENEKQILEAEKQQGIEKRFLSEIDFGKEKEQGVETNRCEYFPLHSMKSWLNEMKLYWYISRIRDLEINLSSFPEHIKQLWLLTINSDILSSVEKKCPHLEIGKDIFSVDTSHSLWDGVIPNKNNNSVILERSERSGERQDYLAYLGLLMKDKQPLKEMLSSWERSNKPHLLKAFARLRNTICS